MRLKTALAVAVFLALVCVAGGAHLNMHEVTLTTTDETTAVGYTDDINGYIVAWQYVHSTFTSAFEATIETATTGVILHSFQDLTESMAGRSGMVVYATNTTATFGKIGYPVVEPWPVADERIKISVANVGTPTTGTFRIWSDGAR
jgi:hypothetical protein